MVNGSTYWVMFDLQIDFVYDYIVNLCVHFQLPSPPANLIQDLVTKHLVAKTSRSEEHSQ